MRRGALAAGVCSSALASVLVAGVVAAPLLPSVDALMRPGHSPVRRPVLATTRTERERRAARRRLHAALARGAPAGAPARPEAMRARSLGAVPRSSPGPGGGDPIVAGFYVNWDDNSLASFRAHAGDLDWVVCEWAFVEPSGDSLRLAVDRRLLRVVQGMPPADRPGVHAMVTNFDPAAGRFDPARLRRLVATRPHRARAVAQLTELVRAYALSGVTVDFEEVPDDLHPAVASFVRDLAAALRPAGAVVTQAVPPDLTGAQLRAYASAADKLFVMLYDEHFGRGEPGPVAGQAWYAARAQRVAREVPPEKLIYALGAYGYEWNDADPRASGEERTFQDVMTAARENGATVRVDARSLNPYLAWTDPDSTDHVLWYLDATTAYNQVLAGRALGAAGHAVWRLGSEDPALWRVLGRRGLDGEAAMLGELAAGYDVQVEGAGELLRLTAQPTTGRRVVRVDSATGLVVGQRVTAYPSPYVVTRVGARPGMVALTFDDGPDGAWTPMILDTLRSRRAPATFFVIGRNVEAHIPLTRRIFREGHELGNHTFTHPNLALTAPFVTRLELDATERVIEAVLGRRSVFFRPPYFGDAEPTTADELVPVGIATSLGYLTAGLHVDSDDWRRPGAAEIVRNVLALRARGNVVLLHDGGGDRAQTVAALGPLIDSLRVRGDTLVLLSALAGLSHAGAMPELPPSSAVVRLAELSTFVAIGALEWGLEWLFLAAVVLGAGRLVVITGLALVQRARGRRASAAARCGCAPDVSVVVPAYREERVIVQTIASLLAQQYPGGLEVVVVDDGSPDGTYDAARAAFGAHPRVSVLAKPNGGKASALNFGVARARGEVVVALDADTVFAPDAVARLVEPLADPRVGAVAGNAKVGNRINLVTRWQALEYVTSQNLDRRAFALLDCITVVPGAIGAWRTALVREAGGFSDDTLAEDQDLTLAIRRRGHSVAYADRAVAYTEAPDTFRGLARQRFRWSFGTLQCMWKHRDALFRPRCGTLGLVALPNVWLFQLLFTALSPLTDLLFLWSLASVWLVRQEHGATYALANLEQVLALYAVFLLVDWAAAVIAFLIETGEDKRLTWLILLQRFAYRQVMYWVVGKSFVAAVRGRVVGWGTLERKATVAAPAA